MNRLGIMFILGALIISAILTGIVYKHQKQRNEIANQQPASIDVLVATRNLSRGVIITDMDITWKSLPRIATSPQFIIKGVRDRTDVVGSLVREPINVGEPISDQMFVAKSVASPLASVLKPGMRAFNIDVTLASSLGGMVTPGDRVDVILTYSYTKQGSYEKQYVTKTILLDIPVIAVDQSLSPEAPAKSASKYGASANSKDVTLEVTPKEAEILALAQSMGTLSLSLTSPLGANQSVNNTALPSVEGSDISNEGDQGGSANLTLIHGDKLEQTGKNGS